MDRNRLWIIGTIAAMFVVVVAGWFLGIQPQLSAASASSEALTTVTAQNAASQSLLGTLKADFDGIDKVKGAGAALRKSVPSSAQLPSFVTELDALSGQTGVAVATITISDAEAYTPPAIAAAAPAAASTPTPAPSASAAPTPVAPVRPAAPALVTNPKITSANFIAIPIDVKITGPYANVLNFVKGLQSGERLFLVTNLSTEPQTDKTAQASAVRADVKGLIYVLLAEGTK